MKNGTYAVRFTQNAAGDCRVVVRVENAEVTPITVTINTREEKAPGAEKGG